MSAKSSEAVGGGRDESATLVETATQSRKSIERYLLPFAYESEQPIFSSSSSINAIPNRVLGPMSTVTVVTRQLSKEAPLRADGIGCAVAGSTSPAKALPSGHAGILVKYVNRVKRNTDKV